MEFGPVCLLTHSPATSALQLEGRSSSGSRGCTSTGPEEGERLCQSTMVPNRACPHQNMSSESSGNFGGFSLEGPSLISSSSGDVEGLPMTRSSTGVSAAEGGSTGGDKITPQLAVWAV